MYPHWSVTLFAHALLQMNTSLLHPSGALLLEPIGQVVIEVKMVNKDPIPITYDTPANKIKGWLSTYGVYVYVQYTVCVHVLVYIREGCLAIITCNGNFACTWWIQSNM